MFHEEEPECSPSPEAGFHRGANHTLPAGYREIRTINLDDPKFELISIGLAVLIGAAMIIPANYFIPITLFDESGGLLECLMRPFALIYGFLFEAPTLVLISGKTMNYFGTDEVTYEIDPTPYVSSRDYYDRKSYGIILLAPTVIFLLVLGALNFLISEYWFWVFYLLQVVNLAEAGNRIFIVFQLAKLPEDILIRDSGLRLIIYSEQ